MKYLNHCLPKGNLLNVSISLTSISFIEIGFLYRWNSYYWKICKAFYPLLHMVLIFFMIFLIYSFLFFLK